MIVNNSINLREDGEREFNKAVEENEIVRRMKEDSESARVSMEKITDRLLNTTKQIERNNKVMGASRPIQED